MGFDCALYRDADKSLTPPTSGCILFDGGNVAFHASLVIYINSTNIPPILIINRIYENQNLLLLYLVSFLVGLRTYQHPCTAYVDVFIICDMSSVVLVGLSPSLFPLPLYLVESGGVSM